MAEPSGDERGKIGLVLAGGGARGPYEIGALSVVLPRLWEERKERPDIIVGTSVGAINAAYLAATSHEPAEDAVAGAAEIWREMRWRDALRSLWSPRQLALGLRAAADLIGVPGVRTWSMLDVDRFRATLEDRIPLDQIGANVEARELETAAVVATHASTSWSVVFCATNCRRLPEPDPRRGVEYQRSAGLGVDHVLASAAIPGAFPAVEITEPEAATGWYYDGGTRLNTPIKPALDLGAERLIVVALHCVRLPRDRPALGARPETLNGASQLIQGLLVDPLVNDIHTMTAFNEVLKGTDQAREEEVDGKRPIEYILVAPQEPLDIGALAETHYRRCYTGLRGLPRRLSSIGLMGRSLDVLNDPERGELFSYFFFDQLFADALIERGRSDAERWFEQLPDENPWTSEPPP
jgi:NTE family protein